MRIRTEEQSTCQNRSEAACIYSRYRYLLQTGAMSSFTAKDLIEYLTRIMNQFEARREISRGNIDTDST